MSPDPVWPWSVLSLPDQPATLADVRRAYARALKQIDQSADIAGFSALRAAYFDASQIVKGAAGANPPPQRTASAVIVMPTLPRANEQDPVPSPDELRLQATEALFERLLPTGPLGNTPDCLIACLNDPLSHDPDIATRLRAQIAHLLRQNTRGDADKGLYLPLAFRPALLEAESRFRWLSDYASFQKDFPYENHDTLLLDAMLACAGFKTKSPPSITPLPKPATILEKTAAATKSYIFWGGLAVLLIAAMTAEHLKQAHLQGPIYIALALWVLVPMVANTFVSTGMAMGWLGKFLTSQKESIEDRRALRAKGLLPPERRFFLRNGGQRNFWTAAGLFLAFYVFHVLM